VRLLRGVALLRHPTVASASFVIAVALAATKSEDSGGVCCITGQFLRQLHFVIAVALAAASSWHLFAIALAFIASDGSCISFICYSSLSRQLHLIAVAFVTSAGSRKLFVIAVALAAASSEIAVAFVAIAVFFGIHLQCFS
jgi:ABC-type multidrug transport system permease subunit